MVAIQQQICVSGSVCEQDMHARLTHYKETAGYWCSQGSDAGLSMIVKHLAKCSPHTRAFAHQLTLVILSPCRLSRLSWLCSGHQGSTRCRNRMPATTLTALSPAAKAAVSAWHRKSLCHMA
jgi:hypothetical protein